MELNQHLTPKLKQLRLSGMLATLEARARQAVAMASTHRETP